MVRKFLFDVFHDIYVSLFAYFHLWVIFRNPSSIVKYGYNLVFWSGHSNFRSFAIRMKMQRSKSARSVTKRKYENYEAKVWGVRSESARVIKRKCENYENQNARVTKRKCEGYEAKVRSLERTKGLKRKDNCKSQYSEIINLSQLIHVHDQRMTKYTHVHMANTLSKLCK